MIPGKRDKRQKAKGFPIEKARQIFARFGPDGQDMTFEQFYRELLDMNDEKKMKADLETIQFARSLQGANEAKVQRALEHAD